MRTVLGPRALGLLGRGGGEHGDDGGGSGNLGLAEELKDGRLLVRLAHAVGGARTAGMAEVGPKTIFNFCICSSCVFRGHVVSWSQAFLVRLWFCFLQPY